MADLGSRTRHKLQEARFFLERLPENYGKLKKFDYYLSAYISSARSVIWVMGGEFKRVPGWATWFKGQKPGSEEAALLKGTNKLRIRTEKRGALRTNANFKVDGITVPNGQAEAYVAFMKAASARGTPIPVSLTGKAGKFEVTFEMDGQQMTYPATEVYVRRNVDEFPDNDILEICTTYYACLERVVNDCLKRFGVQQGVGHT